MSNVPNLKDNGPSRPALVSPETALLKPTHTTRKDFEHETYRMRLK